ncbi:hypothetical protein A2U01_0078220, partial [Trifolium medium]|nr:hypothetical protein [Trifolium medium]
MVTYIVLQRGPVGAVGYDRGG